MTCVHYCSFPNFSMYSYAVPLFWSLLTTYLMQASYAVMFWTPTRLM